MAEEDAIARTNLDGLYGRLRAQVEHENQLYNQRIAWLISMEAILFAAIALLIQAVTSAPEGAWQSEIYGVMAIICALGALVALVCDRLLANARTVIAILSRLWSTRSAEFPLDLLRYYPHIDGGDGRAKRGVFLRSGQLPKYFALVWVVVALVLFTRQMPKLWDAIVHSAAQIHIALPH